MLAGGHDLRIVGLDRRGDDDRTRIGKVLGPMADLDRNAHRAKTLDVGAVGLVAAAHLVAERIQDLGDTTHADAADADEVDDAYGEGKLLHAAFSRAMSPAACMPLLWMSEVTSSASRFAASRRPSRCAAPAAAARVSGRCISIATRSASAVGSVVASGISQAAPAALIALAFAV